MASRSAVFQLTFNDYTDKMKKLTLLIKTLAICIAVSFVTIKGETQTLSVEECINAYTKDTPYMKSLYNAKGFDLDTLVAKGGMYTRTFKRKKGGDVLMLMKVADKTFGGDVLTYSFESVAQYDKFRNDLKSSKFKPVDSGPIMFIVEAHEYTLGKLSITLTKSAKDLDDLSKPAKEIKAFTYGLVISDQRKL